MMFDAVIRYVAGLEAYSPKISFTAKTLVPVRNKHGTPKLALKSLAFTSMGFWSGVALTASIDTSCSKEASPKPSPSDQAHPTLRRTPVLLLFDHSMS